MPAHLSKTLSILLIILTGAVLLSSPWAATSSRAGDAGTLKLKVIRCGGTNWLSGAEVDVVIHRPGVGQVDSSTGTTSGAGYVQFSFSDLENDDEAHVTVTPSGDPPDDGHTYYWSAPGGPAVAQWSLEEGQDTACPDTWYDQKNNIIQCYYND